MRRVLVVDDNAEAAWGLQRLLECDGYEAAAEHDPARALARLQREPFDAVVTDLEMPRVHGTEVVRAVRAAHPSAPIFVVTAHTSSFASAGALAAGATRVFEKPLDYDVLAEELGRRLNG